MYGMLILLLISDMANQVDGTQRWDISVGASASATTNGEPDTSAFKCPATTEYDIDEFADAYSTCAKQWWGAYQGGTGFFI
jgi:hypothetical protein